MSVITIGHNVRPELEQCLASVKAFSEVSIEVFVVDNDSSDDTVAWVHREHPDVELILLDRNAFGAARNPAMLRARAKYTLCIDSDAKLTPGALPMMVAALDANPSWGLIGPRLVYPDGELQLSCRRFPPRTIPLMRRPPLSLLLEASAPVRRHQMEDIDHSCGRPVPYMIGACHLFRTSLVGSIGLLDPRLGWGGVEDVDWCIRVWDAGSEVRYLPQATVVHSYRRQSKQSPVSWKGLRHLRSFGALQRKYYDRYRQLFSFGDELDRRADLERAA